MSDDFEDDFDETRPDNRSRKRVAMQRMAFARAGDKAHAGITTDISAGGAAVQLVDPSGKAENPFEDDEEVELLIDEMSPLAGRIVRALEDRVAVEFLGVDDETENRLIAEIMGHQNNISIDD